MDELERMAAIRENIAYQQRWYGNAVIESPTVHFLLGTIDRQRAVIAQAAEALQAAYDFIGAEYSSVEWEAQHGEAVAPEARPAWHAISEALAAATAAQDGGDDGKG